MTKAFIALGSNLGDREANIANAIAAIDTLPGTQVLIMSSLFETEPFGPVQQPDYLNGVVQCETDLQPLALLTALQTIEHRLGRVRNMRWGPRTIDLDIILYGDTVIETKDLRIPHPEFARRRFVLQPLCELAPTLVPPGYSLSVADLLKTCPDTSHIQAVQLNRSLI